MAEALRLPRTSSIEVRRHAGTRGPENADPEGGVLDDGEDVLAPPGQGARPDEVARQQRVGLGAQEVGPGAGGPFGGRVDALGLEDLPYGGGGDLDAENGPVRDFPPVTVQTELAADLVGVGLIEFGCTLCEGLAGRQYAYPSSVGRAPVQVTTGSVRW
jgi:hypothetical protein